MLSTSIRQPISNTSLFNIYRSVNDSILDVFTVLIRFGVAQIQMLVATVWKNPVNLNLTKTNIILKTFETPLGNVVCGLVSDCTKLNLVGHNTYENGKAEIFETVGYIIELIEFKMRQPLYNGDTIHDSVGWVWKIQKRNRESESIEVFCLFEKPIENVEYDSACGESLDAIEVSNEHWTLHIGTEDGETLNSRAKNEDEFPARLENKVDFYNSITKMQENGLRTIIPKLIKGEILHLQYLSAYDKRNEEKVSTWLAIDQDKRKLENWIGIW